MEHHKISELIKDSTVSKFVARKWIGVSDLSNGQYSTNKNIRFKSPMLRSDLCNYSGAYIVVKRTITVEGTSANNRIDKMLAFKNNASYKSYISKINNIHRQCRRS